MGDDERAVALHANMAAYDGLEESAYVNGAPHLKHSSIMNLYRSLVEAAIAQVSPDDKSVSVLELGAGNGLASLAWFEHGVDLTAVDSSREMLDELVQKAEPYGVKPHTVVADAGEFLDKTAEQFDLVTHVSMLHHVPDYLNLLRNSAARVREGGCLLTFQDPLLYAEMPRRDHLAERAAYFAWRLGQGHVLRGLKTRWRRVRGIYDPKEIVDFEDYHVVRAGVDSDAIVKTLSEFFDTVKVVRYWSTYSRALQFVGERAGLASSFGVLASGRKSARVVRRHHASH